MPGVGGGGNLEEMSLASRASVSACAVELAGTCQSPRRTPGVTDTPLRPRVCQTQALRTSQGDERASGVEKDSVGQGMDRLRPGEIGTCGSSEEGRLHRGEEAGAGS